MQPDAAICDFVRPEPTKWPTQSPSDQTKPRCLAVFDCAGVRKSRCTFDESTSVFCKVGDRFPMRALVQCGTQTGNGLIRLLAESAERGSMFTLLLFALVIPASDGSKGQEHGNQNPNHDNRDDSLVHGNSRMLPGWPMLINSQPALCFDDSFSLKDGAVARCIVGHARRNF